MNSDISWEHGHARDTGLGFSLGFLFVCFLFFKGNRIPYSKKMHLDFDKTELAASILDDLEHSLGQIKRKREKEEAGLGAHCPGCSPVCVVNLAGWPVPPGA